jgi:hypothetical protein
MEPRFGHSFADVRIHTDARAASSAAAVQAYAYTVGRDVVFGAGMYSPTTPQGRRLIAHELAHVVQQEGAADPAPAAAPAEPLAGGGMRLPVASPADPAEEALERQAEAAAERVTSGGAADPRGGPVAAPGKARRRAIQRTRIPLASPIPLCGKTLTHIDIEPPRSRDLVPCKPAGFPVTRINVIGRDLTTPSPGAGPQVFNLHLGYYTDPVTGRLCAIADDSKKCVSARCVELGCFRTMAEVIDALLDFVKTVLVILGIIAMAILLALILELLLGAILVPLLASSGGAGGDPGPGAAESREA